MTDPSPVDDGIRIAVKTTAATFRSWEAKEEEIELLAATTLLGACKMSGVFFFSLSLSSIFFSRSRYGDWVDGKGGEVDKTR